MVKKLLVVPLLMVSLIFGACYSHTRYRPKADTIDARMAAEECISSCKESTNKTKKFEECLKTCPGLKAYKGECQPQMDICEEVGELETANTVVLVGLSTVVGGIVTAGVVVVGLVYLAVLGGVIIP